MNPLEEKRIFREDLLEKRPPLYVYKAKHSGKDCFLNEIIPYITTPKKSILDFLKTVKLFSEKQYSDIANILDCKKKGIRILITEESIEGQNLKYLVNQNKPVKPDAAIVLIYSIAHAFQKFHSLGICGLGTEPKNIIIKDAKHISIIHPVFPMAERFFRKTNKPEILNPRYLAPEQIKENVFSEKGDLFTIGVLLFELLNSIYPFSSGTYRLLDFRKYVPPCIKQITERLLSFDPAKRFDSFHDFLQALHVCKDELSSGTVSVPVEKPPAEKKPVKEERKKPKPQPPKETKKRAGKAPPPIKKKEAKPAEKKPRIPPKPRKRRKRPRLKLKVPKKPLIIGVSALIALILLAVFIPRIIRMIRPYEIASLSFERNMLKALDGQGIEQWTFKTAGNITFCRTVDIDHDEREEILLGTSTLLTTEKGIRKEVPGGAQFYVLNANGRVLHRSELGMPSIYDHGSSRWSLYDVYLIDLNDDGRLDLIPLAMTDDHLDCLLLSHIEGGADISFWHTGALSHISLHQTPEGLRMLLCAGTNSRMGDKPVLFAISATDCIAQSPPWEGQMGEIQQGLLWYRFLPGGGSVATIEMLDDTVFRLTTTQQREKRYHLDGHEIIKTDTTGEMIAERMAGFEATIALFKRAMDAKKSGDTQAMISLLNEALELKQASSVMKSTFHYMKGREFLLQKSWNAAYRELSRAADGDPGYYGPLLELARSYLGRAQLSNAAAFFNKTYKLSGKETHFYQMIDAYVALGRYREAKNALKRIAGKGENTISFLMATADVARAEGNFNTAISSYEEILKNEPYNLEVNILLADAYAEINRNIPVAESLFQDIAERDSLLVYNHIETSAWIRYRKSAFEQALSDIEQAIRRDEAIEKTSLSARLRLPRIYYRKAIIAQPLGLKEEKEEAVRKARDSRFCNGYIKKQLDYLIGSP